MGLQHDSTISRTPGAGGKGTGSVPSSRLQSTFYATLVAAPRLVLSEAALELLTAVARHPEREGAAA